MAKYEMSVIIKALAREPLKEALKRQVTRLIENGSIVYDVENLGLKRLPNLYHVQKQPQYEGHYFLIKFDGTHKGTRFAVKEAVKDSDFIKCNSCLVDDGWRPPCEKPNAELCEFGEIRNPNHEKTNRRWHTYRHY